MAIRRAYFDLSGTILNYRTPRSLPLMAELLCAMSKKGWDISILSRYSTGQCKNLLKMAEITLPDRTRILSSLGSNKGGVLAADIRDQRAGESIFIDDKPENLESVINACGNSVRVIGVVGSRKYVPALSQWCAKYGVELALSPIDLCEGLGVSLHGINPFHFDHRFTEDELISLIPGLDHPLSAIGGETAHFDHRFVFSMLYECKSFTKYDKLWLNLGWITCNECLWKALVESVVLALALDRSDVLGKAYKAYEYTEAIRSFALRNLSVPLKSTFQKAITTMSKGIQEIGVDAEECRIANRPIERDRLLSIAQRFQECFG